MTTTREQIIKMIALVTENWEPPIHPEAVISALVHIGIPTESLVALANGWVVVPGHLSEITDAIQNAGNIRIWNNINDRDGRRIEVKFAAKDTK